MSMFIRGTPGVDWPLCPACGQGDELTIVLLESDRLQISCAACGWREEFDDRRIHGSEWFGLDRRKRRGNGAPA